MGSAKACAVQRQGTFVPLPPIILRLTQPLSWLPDQRFRRHVRNIIDTAALATNRVASMTKIPSIEPSVMLIPVYGTMH